MRRSILALLLAVALIACAAATSFAGEKSAWRVDGKLVREGDPRYEVRTIAGEPDHRDVRTIEEEYGSDEHVVTIWTYESDREIHRVFFEEDVVMKIVWERK